MTSLALAAEAAAFGTLFVGDQRGHENVEPFQFGTDPDGAAGDGEDYGCSSGDDTDNSFNVHSVSSPRQLPLPNQRTP